MIQEEKLRLKLRECKNILEFKDCLVNFLENHAEPGTPFVIDRVFAEKEKRGRGLLIGCLKDIIDSGQLYPQRDVDFNSDYSKFRVTRVYIPKKKAVNSA